MKYKQDYGVYKNSSGDSYIIKFWNVISNKYENLGSSKDEAKAKSMYSTYQFNFYSKHKYLLPKGVCLDYSKRKFNFAIYFDNKTIFNKRFDTVQLCLKYRDKLLLAIIS